MPATCFLSTRFMRRILSVDDNSNDSLVIFLLMTWSTSHNPEQCSIQQHQVKAQPAFVPQLICPANFPWELLSLNDNLGKFIIDGCPGVGVCLVKHSVTPQNSFAAVRAYSKGEVVSFIDPRLPSILDTRHPCRDLVLLSERKKCSFCKSSSTCPIQSMLFAGKGCAQLLLCSPGQGVNTELLSVGPFSIYLNGSTTTHSLVVARTTEYVSAGNIFVMNCAYQLEDDTKALSTLDLKTLPQQSQALSTSLREESSIPTTSPIQHNIISSARVKTLNIVTRTKTVKHAADNDIDDELSNFSPTIPLQTTVQQAADNNIDGDSSNIHPSMNHLKLVAPRTDENKWVRSDFSNDYLMMKYITSNAPLRPFLWPDDIVAIHKKGSPFDIRTRTMPVFHFDFDVPAAASFDQLMALFQSQNNVQWSYTQSPSTLTRTNTDLWSSTQTLPILVSKVRTTQFSHFQQLLPFIVEDDVDLTKFSAEVFMFHSDQKLLRETLKKRHCIAVCRGEVRVAWTTTKLWAALEFRYVKDYELIDVDQGRDLHFVRKLTPGYILYGEPRTLMQLAVKSDSVILLLTARDGIDDNCGAPLTVNALQPKPKKLKQAPAKRGPSVNRDTSKKRRVIEDDDDDDKDHIVEYDVLDDIPDEEILRDTTPTHAPQRRHGTTTSTASHQQHERARPHTETVSSRPDSQQHDQKRPRADNATDRQPSDRGLSNTADHHSQSSHAVDLHLQTTQSRQGSGIVRRDNPTETQRLDHDKGSRRQSRDSQSLPSPDLVNLHPPSLLRDIKPTPGATNEGTYFLILIMRYNDH